MLASALSALLIAACGSTPHSSLPVTSTSGRSTTTTTTTVTTVTTATASTAPPSKVAGSGSDWTTYHGSAISSGVDTSGARIFPPHHAWTSETLDGSLFGEPLVWDYKVIVATENDTVYELSASTGKVVWSDHVGTPVRASELACGDITPVVGVTSTPVIDPARKEVFVVAFESSSQGVAHHLVGLDLQTGKILLDKVVDPPGSIPLTQLQRPGLALDKGRIVVAFGGNDGDCGDYHGWVESVPEVGGSESSFEVDPAPGDIQGAVWMGGASPVIDASGNVWVSVGNGSVTSSSGRYDDSDSVLELSPEMKLEQYFAPTSWASDNASDLDLGSTSPALLSDGLVLEVGKAGLGYLNKQSSLGGIGGEVASVAVCPGVADGGDAVLGSVVYVPCANGVTEVKVSASPPGLRVGWTTSTASSGSPIIASGYLWSISRSGTLWGINLTNGDSVFQASLGSEATHFPTPTVADALLIAPGDLQVVAFAGPQGVPTGP